MRDGVPVPLLEGVLDAVIVVEAVPLLLGVALGVVEGVPVPELLGVFDAVPVPDWLGVLEAVALLDRLGVDVTDGQPNTSLPSAS